MAGMERRALGRTGASLSVIGFGGILVTDETPAEAARLVGRGIDRGLNYFDVAPTYGNAEERLGPALEPYRKNVFLACKTTERTKAGAAASLRKSLKLLRTDHFDLFQHHCLASEEDVKTAFGPGGAMEAMVEARQAGLVRFLGFSAHTEEAALDAMDLYDFDTILFPLSRSSWFHGEFGPRVVARAKEKGMGILALKMLGKRPWREGEKHVWSKTWYSPVESYAEALENVRFTLSLPVTAGPCPGHEQLLDWACDAAEEIARSPRSAPTEGPEGVAPIFSAAAK